MRNPKEFIIQLKEYIYRYEIEDNILERLYFHTCVEFKLNNHIYPYRIDEKYGKFDNAGLVVKHIIDKLKTKYRSQVIDCSEFNVFFKKIDITIDNSGTHIASYDSLKNDILYIEILCESKKDFIKDIDVYVKLIVHELLHAYEDYNRINKTGKSIFDFYGDKYINSFTSVNSENEIKKYLSRCNYFLISQERNAYLSQLEYDIESIFKNEHIKIEDFNYTKFKENLKKTDIWKEYFNLSLFILKLYNSKLDNEQIKYIEDIWQDLYSEKKTFNQIRKELYNKWQKFEKKFEQLVPKIICKYIETNLKEVAFDVSLLDKEKYWETII